MLVITRGYLGFLSWEVPSGQESTEPSPGHDRMPSARCALAWSCFPCPCTCWGVVPKTYGQVGSDPGPPKKTCWFWSGLFDAFLAHGRVDLGTCFYNFLVVDILIPVIIPVIRYHCHVHLIWFHMLWVKNSVCPPFSSEHHIHFGAKRRHWSPLAAWHWSNLSG